MKKIEGYTPKPWKKDGNRVLGPLRNTPTEQNPETVVAQCHAYCGPSGDHFFSEREVAANAELIASAPETYERCVVYEDALRKMMAAIPKEPPTDMTEALRWHESQVEAAANVVGLLLDNGIAVVSPLRMGKGCVVQLPNSNTEKHVPLSVEDVASFAKSLPHVEKVRIESVTKENNVTVSAGMEIVMPPQFFDKDNMHHLWYALKRFIGDDPLGRCLLISVSSGRVQIY